jgi:plasmid stabilization system protein ParE
MRNHTRGVTWHHIPRALVVGAPTRAEILKQFEVFFPGEVFLGHVEADPEVMAFIDSHGFRTLFIYRDPRDVVVSLLHWWKRDPTMTWEEPDSWPFRYFQTLDSDEDRLTFLIKGWPQLSPAGFPSDVDFPDIGERFRAFTPWIDSSSCLAIRFEDLKDPARSPGVVRAIAHHLYPRASERRLDKLVARMEEGADPSRSRTFRKGGSGGWREAMTDHHRQLFKKHAGRLLVDLGYEDDLDW